MLHFVYNRNVVSVLVCHDIQEGEFVLQVPYFPPVESIEDYKSNRDRCVKLIVCIGRRSNNIGIVCGCHNIKTNGGDDILAESDANLQWQRAAMAVVARPAVGCGPPSSIWPERQ